MTVDCMREQLLEGKKIRLGDLGDFFIVLSSKGAEDADKFTAQNITDVKVLWEPGSEFKNLLADAEFNLVASRSAQAAVIKAIKAGKANVDLSIPTTLLATVQMVVALTQAATIRATQDRATAARTTNCRSRPAGATTSGAPHSSRSPNRPREN